MDSRPNVRLIKQEHVDQYNYTKALQYRSIGTLEDTGRSYLTMNLEKIDENCKTPEVTIQSTPEKNIRDFPGRRTYKLLKDRQGRTVSNITRK